MSLVLNVLHFLAKEYNLHTNTTVSKTESSVDALEEIFNTSFTILPCKAEVEITSKLYVEIL